MESEEAKAMTDTGQTERGAVRGEKAYSTNKNHNKNHKRIVYFIWAYLCVLLLPLHVILKHELYSVPNFAFLMLMKSIYELILNNAQEIKNS